MRSLADFVGYLLDELLLCPVCALHIYLARTASLPSRPRALFVSPRAPACSLSKNALSYFIQDVIAESYSLSGLSLPSVSSSSSSTLSASSSRPRSSAHAHGVRGVAPSWAFHRNAPLVFASVFTSFYLSDVQFSSSQGFNLGLAAAAGAVVWFSLLDLDRLSSCCFPFFSSWG